MLAFSLPGLGTGTGHDHGFHALIVERGCLILSSDKKETYQVNDVEFSHDVGILLIFDREVKPLSTSSGVHVIL
jgi:hypothetical protein